MDEKSCSTGVLRGDVKLLRGESLLLFDPASAQYYKISPHIANIIAYFSEDTPLSTMVEKLQAKGIRTTCEELFSIRNFLRSNGLLVPRYGETALRVEQQASLKKKTWLLRLSAAYLFFKLPPLRPGKFLKKAAPYLSFFASKKCVAAMCIPALAGYLLALRDFGKVTEQFADTLSWTGLAKYILAIMAVKCLHELAHCLAAIHFHCPVRGVGLGFIFFVPRLYTDTTDSWLLPRKQRLFIDGAGIFAELLTGGVAALFWNILTPGVWQSTMFYIFAISTLSTLLVNGNIFIRYDGYYILCDILGVENLMSRASNCMKESWRYCFLGLGKGSSEKRKFLLISYGICAFIYRIFLYTSICVVIYYSFMKTLAVLMLILEIYALLLYPLWQEIRTIGHLSRKSASKGVWYILFSFAAIFCAVLFIPFSRSIVLAGECVPEKRVLVTAGEGGYLERQLPEEAKKVEKGEILGVLQSPELGFAIEKIIHMEKYNKILYLQQELDEKEFVRKSVTARKIESDKLALNELKRKKEFLIIKSPASGIYVPGTKVFSPGAYINRNTVTGEVVSRKNILYAYAAEDQVGKIKKGDKGYAYLPDSLKKIPCKVKVIHPVAVHFHAPSPVLQYFGGSVAAYAEKENEFVPVQTLYRIELEILEEFVIGAGRSVQVKLVHTEQLYIHVRKVLLSFFRKEF